ncbi:MAG TPA: asparagine synthase-related protein, partial [Polyangiaceae bacterium]|nr:asparagine synthase-related protein [Polyangiaceae bacterium]
MTDFALAVPPEPLKSIADLDRVLTDSSGWALRAGVAFGPGALSEAGETSDCWATGCVRLDEKDLLRSRLGSVPTPARSDVDLVVAAYLRWGTACATHLMGDYAFALWDGQRRRLLVARDSCGSVPLYYCEVDGHLVVSSDLRVLLRVRGVVWRANRSAIVDYIAELPMSEFETAFAQIRRIPPGHRLLWEDGEAHLQRHYLPRPRPTFSDKHECIHGFLGVLRKAVSARMPSGRSGVLLSGGLDSSLIAALVAEMAPSKVVTFSGTFTTGVQWDEQVHQRAVVDHIGAEHYPVRIPDSSEGAGIEPAL